MTTDKPRRGERPVQVGDCRCIKCGMPSFQPICPPCMDVLRNTFSNDRLIGKELYAKVGPDGKSR